LPKLAAGFTNSASLNGDKFSTIEYFWTLSQQHGQVWIGTGLLPANKKESGPTDVNWTAGFAGALAVSPADASPDEAPRSGDLETAKHLGKRVADFALVSVRPSKPVSDTWGSMDRCQARSLLCPMADPAAVSAERMFSFGSFRLLPSRWLLLDGETRVPLWISMSLLAESHGWEDKATSRLDQASMQGTRQEMVLQDWNRRGVHPAHRAARGNARSADGKGADVFSLGGL
jgi:hypothetical protein